MPRGVGLDRARLIALAGALVDAEGADALTVHRLAALAGVKAPSLYKHVEGIHEVEAALALEAWQALAEALDACGGDVREAVFAWRGWALAHPGRWTFASRRHDQAPPALHDAGRRVLDAVLDRLGGSGPDDAVHVARGLRALVHGFVALELDGGFGLPQDVDTSFRRAVEALLAAR